MDIPYIVNSYNSDERKIFGNISLTDYNYSKFHCRVDGNIYRSISLFLKSDKSKYFSKEEIKLIYELISSEDRDNYMIAYSIITNREEK